jgi:hypothetical protein
VAVRCAAGRTRHFWTGDEFTTSAFAPISRRLARNCLRGKPASPKHLPDGGQVAVFGSAAKLGRDVDPPCGGGRSAQV